MALIRTMGWAAWLLSAVLCLHGAEMERRTNSISSAELGSEFVVRSWTTEEGLPQNTVLCLLQSSDGYMWAGTLDGLARFDGLKFTVFDQQNTPAFRNHAVLALAEQPAGCLWIGTRGGLVHYCNHVFSQVALGEGEVLVSSICARHAGGVWLGTDRGPMRVEEGGNPKPETRNPKAVSKGLRTTGEGRKVFCYTNYPGFDMYSPGHGARCRMVNCLTEDANGTLWVGDDRGVVRLRPSAGEFEIVYAANPTLGARGQGASTLVADEQGGIWFGNAQGLYRFFRDKLQCYPGEANGFVGWPSPQLWDGRGLWITDNTGFANRREDGPLVHYRLPGGLAVEESRCMAADREGNLWFGTHTGGLALMQRRRLKTLTPADGLANEDAWSICEGLDGSVWIATDSGLSQYANGACKTYLAASPPMDPMNRFHTVLVSRSGTVWAGGSKLWQLRGEQLVPVPAEIGAERFDLPVQSLYEDPAGALWVGSGNLFRLKEGKWDLWGPNIAPGRHNVLPNPSVLGVLQDAAGDTWVGTKGGLCRFRGEQSECFTTTNGFPADIAGPVLADPDGTVWFCSSKGVIRFRHGRFFLISQKQGLFEDLVYNVLEDDFGWFWLNGNRGLQRVRKQDLNDLADGKISRLQCLRYGVADGMLSAEGNGEGSPNSCKTRDGRLWFPTTKGVVLVDPRTLMGNEAPPTVVIEQVIANGEVVFGDGRGGDGRMQNEEGRSQKTEGKQGTTDHGPRTSAFPVRLGPGRARSLLIRYTANSFVSPERTRFACKLDGHDKAWSEDSSNLRTAIYTDLRPGRYQFRVKAFNSHGVASVRDAEFDFSLAPWFYQTWPFYVLCVTTVLAIATGLHLLRMNALRRIQQLEQQHALDVERARIARDMHDSLAADLTRIALLADMAQRQSSQRADRSQWSKAGDLARGLVDGIGELIWATNPRNNSLDTLAAYLRGYASEFLDAAGLHCRFEFPDEVPPLPISGEARRHLFLAAKEALSNVAKHAHASRVVLGLGVAEGQVVISVDDDGCGFTLHQSPAAEGPADNLQWSGGNGLRNLRERLGAIGGRCVIQSTAGSGTRIRLTAPLASLRARESRH
jgi:signal transduction histidine kinase/ligand-binding sensor domain-containing protein